MSLKKFFFPLFLALLFNASLFASDAQKNPKIDISYADAVVLGIVEGVTEYLPVSSTGHLILANAFLKLDNEEPLLNAQGEIIRDKKGKEFSLKRAADAYAIVIQFGAIMAVALIYRKEILDMLMGVLGKNPAGLRLLVNLIVAFLPAAIIGFLMHDFIEAYLFGVKPVIMALAVGAVLMFIVQKIYDKRAKSKKEYPAMENLGIGNALLIGLLQCIAMWPGTSRSMMTILGGYIAGLRPAEAAKFSFLLGLITLSAASFYKAMKDGQTILQSISAGPLLLGLILSFICAAISVKWLVGFLTRRGLAPFAWYRLALAAILWSLLYFNLN